MRSDNETVKKEETLCPICGFKAKSMAGLSNHIGTKGCIKNVDPDTIDVVNALVDVVGLEDREMWQETGVSLGRMFTEGGYPLDMALDHFNTDKTRKLAMVLGASTWLIDHKRKSNAGDESIERQRKQNYRMMVRFVKTGEVGIY